MKGLFTLTAAVLLPLLAQAAQPDAKLQQAIEQLAGKTALKGALLGVSVVRCEDGASVAAYNRELRLTPASNAKLVTTGCALHAFGADHRFQTGLGYTGSISDGTLEGDLYIIGGGDPTVGAKDSIALRPEALFWKWKTLLKNCGIQRIHGRIIGDGSAYEGHLEHASWSYDDMGTYYGTGGSALCFYENTIDFGVEASAPGQPVHFTQQYPQTPWMHLQNYSVTGPAGTGNSLYLYTTDLAPYAQLRGSFAEDRRPKTEHFANKFGALTCAYYFWKNLKETGWEVGGNYAFVDRSGNIVGADFLPQGPAQKPAPLACTEGPKLSEIARETAWRSDNFYAEALLRAMGEAASGNACYDSCAVALNDVIRSLGLNPEEAILVDGSGLSRKNALSAGWLTEFLQAMLGSPEIAAFLASLPAPGQGTLEGIRLPGGERLRMKSGSMEGVLCYSGYILDRSGAPAYSFSILTGNATAPQREVRAVLVRFLENLLSL